MNTPSNSTNWQDEYAALVGHVGIVDLTGRTQIELRGGDRASWLHNLTTNEIRKLEPGAGCESFLTSVQGRILAHAMIFVAAESIVLDTVAGQAAKIIEHLDHYLITEDVTVTDRSNDWGELLLAGGGAAALLAKVADSQPPEAHLAHAPITIAGSSVWARRTSLTGPVEFLISGPTEHVAAAKSALCQSGAVECRADAFQAARIEWGFPCYGADISDKNLPQEVARDEQTISFVKGCYLGQETVARIDALGHVNQTLVGLRFEQPEIPQAGLELTAHGKPVGTITSASFSPHFDAPLALGYVRTGSNAPGTALQSACGSATVVTLPIR